MDGRIHSYANTLLSNLETKFEKDLFDACITSLNDVENKLCFNNFAYSIRELSRHFLKRLAPDSEVKGCAWFSVSDPLKPSMITRKQRIKYAIQSKLSDDFIEKQIGIDVESLCDIVVKQIDVLNKYTHIEDPTLGIPFAKVETLSIQTMSAFNLLFKKIKEFQSKILDKLVECVDESLVANLFLETQNSIDELATHYSVEEYTIDDIKPLILKDTVIHCVAKGMVSVRLQYGSDYDMRIDNGYETYQSFPFSGEFTYNIEDGKLILDKENFEVDTDEYWE